MTAPERMSGVLSPVVTAFSKDLSVDTLRMAAHCRWLLSQNCGLAIFGTNSEGNSLTVAEKIALLEDLVAAGIDPTRMMPGNGCCALPDTVELTRKAVELGCGGVLMLPPFYYKNASDEGLYRAFAEAIERVGDSRLRVYLYHIPPMAQVPLSVALIDRLVKEFPDTVVGIKDSGGDMENTLAMLRVGWDDFRIFVGSESFLLENMRHGGSGSIAATANINPAAINDLYLNWQADDADDRQAQLDNIRGIVTQNGPLWAIAGIKAAISHYGDDEGWGECRPPLVALTAAEKFTLINQLDAEGFEMLGLQEARVAAE